MKRDNVLWRCSMSQDNQAQVCTTCGASNTINAQHCQVCTSILVHELPPDGDNIDNLLPDELRDPASPAEATQPDWPVEASGLPIEPESLPPSRNPRNRFYLIATGLGVLLMLAVLGGWLLVPKLLTSPSSTTTLCLATDLPENGTQA